MLILKFLSQQNLDCDCEEHDYKEEWIVEENSKRN